MSLHSGHGCQSRQAICDACLMPEFSEQDETSLEEGGHPFIVTLSLRHMAKIVQNISNTPLVVQVPKEGQALVIELRCLLIVTLTAQHFAQTVERQSKVLLITYLSPQRQAFLQP